MSNMNPEAPEFSSKRTQKLQSQQPQPQQQLPPPPQPSYIPHHHHIHHHHVLHHHVHHHHHHAVPPFQQQQAPSSAPPPAPPSLLQVSKLRPTASEFQPMKNKSSPLSSSTAGAAPPLASPITPTAGNAGLPPPPPPASPPQYNPASSPTKQSVGPMPADVVKSNLNRLATPFTPTKARTSPTNSGAPTFPASPAPTTTTTTSTGTVRLPPPPIAPTTPPSAVEVAPTAAAPEPTAAEAGTSSSSVAPSSPKVEEPLPFAGSQLPVPEKPNEAPAEPIKFNTTWTLHADDHPATFGSQTYAPPVQVRDVSDLQTFWRLWRYCTPPSRCVPSFTYIWFRRDVKPQWEDPKNKNGGSISIALYDRDRIGSGQTKESMDDAFLLALMSLAGESLPESTIVNGIFLKVRPNRPVVLQYWTNISTEAKLRTLAQGIRSVLGRALPAKALEKLEYFSHSQLQQAQAPAAAAQAGKGKQAGRPQRPKAMEPDFTF